MMRTVLAVDLKANEAAIQTYRSQHERVWPDVLASLRRAGIRDLDIYLLGRRLVMIVETDGPDFRRCFAAHLASHPRVAQWEALMRSLQEPPPGAAPGDWWAQMEPVFSLQAGGDAGGVPDVTGQKLSHAHDD
jgi:L-rhamnose mutarotase